MPLALRLSTFGLALLVAGPALAQTQVPGTPYTRIQGPITYTPLSNPTVLINQGSGQYVTVALPFAFRYYDQTFNSVVVGNAGAISFQEGVSITTANQTPGNSTLDGWIAPFWDSLTMQSAQGAHLAYQVEGVAPARWITFEWHRVNRNFSATGMEWFDFQLRLYEGLAGRIEIDYGPQGPTTALSVFATMGMESPMGTQPILFAASGCTSSCTLADYTALIGQRITLVQDPGVEIVPVGIDVPQFATLGVDVPVHVTVANLHGTNLGPFTVSLAASLDETGQNAVPLGELDVSLSPYQTNRISIVANAPPSLGEASHHLVLQVDTGDVVNEVDEQNNVLVSIDRVRFLPSRADFDVVRVSADKTMVAAGGDVLVDVTVRNAGSQPINGGVVALMMSTNTAISPQDVELARFDVTLAPGESRNVSTTVTIPAQTNTGTYWLGALADPDHAIEEVSEANNGRAALTDLRVSGGMLAILTVELPMAIVAQAYNAILIAAGGQEEVTWRITQGMLPQGLGLVGQTGQFFGRPQTEGVYTFTVEAISGAETDTQELTLVVSDPAEPLTIVTRALPNAVIGQEYEFRLLATGGSVTSSLAWSASGLPNGIALSSDGVLSGTAIEIGTYEVDVSITNGVETSMRRIELAVTENANLQIVPTVLPPGTFGEPYRAKINATGGVPPINFILEVGKLPEGLELMPDGAIVGTPMEVGRFRLVIQARDSGPGGTATDVNTFELVVVDTDGFIIETASLPEAIVNQGYTALVKASGGIPPYDWSLSVGRLPMGMLARVDEMGDFLIVGTAAEAGVTNLLIEVVDAQGRRAQRAFALVVSEAPVGPPSDEEKDGCGCTASSDRAARGALLWIALIGLLFVRRRR